MKSNRLYCIYHAYDSKIRDTFYAGYEPQLGAGCSLLCEIVHDQLKNQKNDYKLLIFGYPGVGKGTYPLALMKFATENLRIQKFLEKARRQKADLNPEFSLIHVPCLDIANQYRDSSLLDDELRDLEHDINIRVPHIVVLDELDAFSQEYAQISARLEYWTHKFLDKRNRGIVILGIVNYPLKLYPAVLNRFDQVLYFEPPSQEVIKQILDHCKIPHSKEVAIRLCLERAVIPRQVGVAIERIIKSVEDNPDDLNKLEAKEIFDFFLSYMNTSKDDIQKYESQNKLYCINAANTLDILGKRLEKILEE